MTKKPRVAIAHDYFTQRGGAERVALAMTRAFPDAPLYTTIYNPETSFPELQNLTVHTLPINRNPLLQRDHRFGLPLYQSAIDRAPVIDADVLLVSTTAFAHGFRTTGKKIVYCHSPARFLYLAEDYLGTSPSKSPAGLALSAMRPRLVAWDQKAAQSADVYLANSTVIKQRIHGVYGIDATVLPAPPAVNAGHTPEPIDSLADWSGGFYLVVSRLLPYKNVDKVIEAFRALPHERLVIVGKGPLGKSLRDMAPSNVRMLEGLSDGELAWVYTNARALIAPSFEDYGLTPLEAGALGTPTLALRAGGYLDTVAAGVNGDFFEEPSTESISSAVDDFDPFNYDSHTVSAHVAQFSESHFAQQLERLVRHVTG